MKCGDSLLRPQFIPDSRPDIQHRCLPRSAAYVGPKLKGKRRTWDELSR
jgi:hypothetical protein